MSFLVVYPEKTVIFLSIREFPILLDALSAKREYYFLKAKSLVFTLLSQMIFLFFFLTVHPESKLILCHLSLVMLPYQNLYSVEMLLFRHLIPTTLLDNQPHLDHYALFYIFLHPSPNSLQVEFFANGLKTLPDSKSKNRMTEP